MSQEEAKKKLQELAVQAQLIVDQMTGIAQANKIVSIEFLGGCLQFGVTFESGSSYGPDGTVRRLNGYIPAKGGATIVDYEWRGSHFECWPHDPERTWLFGEDEANWPKTDYEDE